MADHPLKPHSFGSGDKCVYCEADRHAVEDALAPYECDSQDPFTRAMDDEICRLQDGMARELRAARAAQRLADEAMKRAEILQRHAYAIEKARS